MITTVTVFVYCYPVGMSASLTFVLPRRDARLACLFILLKLLFDKNARQNLFEKSSSSHLKRESISPSFSPIQCRPIFMEFICCILHILYILLAITPYVRVLSELISRN